MKLVSLVLLMVCWVGVTNADEPASPTVITGRVTDVLGRPVPEVRVYVVARTGAPHRTDTDKDGRYRVTVSTTGTHGVVIGIGKAHTFRTLLVQPGATNTLDIDIELDIAGGEVIRIEDRKRPVPATKPKPLQDQLRSLPYSDEAVLRDAWARAWLLLDVDETGQVTRLKLLKPPGFGLEKICIDEAFQLRFDPARDKAGQPMKTYLLYTMEWPSYGWLVQGNGTALRRPKDSDQLHVLTHNIRHGVESDEKKDEPGRGSAWAKEPGNAKIGGPWSRPLAAGTSFAHSLGRVPCAGSGPLNLDLQNRAYRDCSQPDLSLAETLPWITRDTAETAVTEIVMKSRLMLVATPAGSRIPPYLGTGITGALLISTVYSWVQFDKYAQRTVDHQSIYGIGRDADELISDAANRDRWNKVAWVMTGVTLAATGVTLWLFDRGKPSFSVQPIATGSGASASFSTTW